MIIGEVLFHYGDSPRLQAPTKSTPAEHSALRDGKRVIQDGPYADTKEMLGGYFIVDVASLDEALAWAARSPNVSTGTTEVRPVLVMAPPSA